MRMIVSDHLRVGGHINCASEINSFKGALRARGLRRLHPTGMAELSLDRLIRSRKDGWLGAPYRLIPDVGHRG